MTAPTPEEFEDEPGRIRPGTYPIGVVSLGAWGADGGGPRTTVESAVCDVCGKWATNVWFAGSARTTRRDLSDVRIQRKLRVTVFACPEHSAEVSDALVDEFGAATNCYLPDRLAKKVARQQGWPND